MRKIAGIPRFTQNSAASRLARIIDSATIRREGPRSSILRILIVPSGSTLIDTSAARMITAPAAARSDSSASQTARSLSSRSDSSERSSPASRASACSYVRRARDVMTEETISDSTTSPIGESLTRNESAGLSFPGTRLAACSAMTAGSIGIFVSGK